VKPSCVYLEPLKELTFVMFFEHVKFVDLSKGKRTSFCVNDIYAMIGR
jgi:hypothetical protein